MKNMHNTKRHDETAQKFLPLITTFQTTKSTDKSKRRNNPPKNSLNLTNGLNFLDPNKFNISFNTERSKFHFSSFHTDTNSLGNQTIQTTEFPAGIGTIYKTSEEMDQDLSNLHKFYFNVNRKNSYNKIDKKIIYSQFKIDDSVSKEEKENIKSLIKPKHIEKETSSYTLTNTINNFNSTFNNQSQLCKTVINCDKEDYKDPIKSMKKLKLNKQIHDNMMSIVTYKQIKMYEDKYNDNVKYLSIMDRMPNPRVSVNMFNSKMKEKMKAEKLNEDRNMQRNPSKKFVAKVNKVLSREDILASVDYHGSLCSYSKMRPMARSQSSLTLCKDTMYLVGGISNDRLFDFWKCSFDASKSIFNWEEVRISGDLPLPRMGHSAVTYKNLIFIYGGNVEAQAEMPKEDITIFSPESRKVSYERCYNKLNLRWRRNHIAEAIGTHMYIHGGIDENGDFLHDSFILDLESFRWNEVYPKETNFRPFSVAYHSSCLVVTSDKRNHSNFNIYKFPEMPKIAVNKIKFEGVYIFGGIDREGNCNNDLRILKIGKKPLEWIKPNTIGSSPQPRQSSFIGFYEELDILILHGGRNDQTSDVYLNDTYILDLYTFNWIKINVFENVPKPRAEFSAIVQSNKLIIFGGTNMQGYIGSDIFMINLDFFENKKKRADYNNLKNMKGHLKNKNVGNNSISSNDTGSSPEYMTNKTIQSNFYKQDTNKKMINIINELKAGANSSADENLISGLSRKESKSPRSKNNLFLQGLNNKSKKLKFAI